MSAFLGLEAIGLHCHALSMAAHHMGGDALVLRRDHSTMQASLDLMMPVSVNGEVRTPTRQLL